jgi:polyisoprenoid-binding protein YceI
MWPGWCVADSTQIQQAYWNHLRIAGSAARGVAVAIDASSISTQNIKRDQDLRGPDFFDAGKYPAITYQGRGIRLVSGSSRRLDGSLTIRGATQAVPLTFTFKGLFPDVPPGKPARAAFHGPVAAKRARRLRFSWRSQTNQS